MECRPAFNRHCANRLAVKIADSRGGVWTGSRHDGVKQMIARDTLAVLRSRA
jgi:hypothetical protein